MTSLAAPLQLRVQGPHRVAAAGLVVRGTLRRRVALRIRLIDGQGRVGVGEAMPLPGFSRDDVDSAERALARVAARCADGGLRVPPGPFGAAQIEAALAPHAPSLASTPSALFALECALLDLLARREGLSAAVWLAAGRPLQPVPVSVLLPDDAHLAVAAAAGATASGHRVLKLKVARSDRSNQQEDELLAAVRTAADDASTGVAAAHRVRLRLDANGAWPLAQAAARLAALARHGIELVEEPVAGAALLQLPPLPVPWAADESLADSALADAILRLPRGRAPAALVLKPAQLGLVRCLELAAAAADRGMGLIVTHSLDGERGLAAARALAAALPMAPWPCGLARHDGLPRRAPASPWLPEPSAPGLGLDAEAEAA